MNSGDSHPWPTSGRLAGVDYGSVRIGIAISDPSQHWVSPLDTYQPRTTKLDIEYFVGLAKNENVVGWVVGLPIHNDGSESQKSLEARSFAKWLTEITGLPHQLMDERFSSAFAEQLLRPAELSKAKRKQRIDRIAAMIILESFLESKRM